MKNKSPKAQLPDPIQTVDAAPHGVRALTVSVPTEVLNLAKTRASLEGTTMSAIVTAALVPFAEGLKDVIARLGLSEKK